MKRARCYDGVATSEWESMRNAAAVAPSHGFKEVDYFHCPSV
ncbi:hypothetical protein [Lysinibacillus xylanilyticus]|uniref:Uncharacterized protein n=1 Tax=Lysinibacillus xylanilyticus TaxID=582475 RepID=A0ABV3VTG3_9BACI